VQHSADFGAKKLNLCSAGSPNRTVMPALATAYATGYWNDPMLAASRRQPIKESFTKVSSSSRSLAAGAQG
jgi:hypothetical protein